MTIRKSRHRQNSSTRHCEASDERVKTENFQKKYVGSEYNMKANKVFKLFTKNQNGKMELNTKTRILILGKSQSRRVGTLE